jgi:hypothetical protein
LLCVLHQQAQARESLHASHVNYDKSFLNGLLSKFVRLLVT